MELAYIKQTLSPEEKILGRFELTVWQYFWPVLTIIIGIGFLWIPWTMLKRKTTELAYTDKRVITKFGIIARNTDEIKINAIESIDIRQGVLGRLFNFGSLIISGTGGKLVIIPDIKDVVSFRKALVDLQ
ncbi:MAG: PH domain-containing protein [Proteobacteria bacterium]|nr:PH domain-containing protein [Pseudomonadota bacterium]